MTKNTDGSWTFTPAKDWNGEVEFNYNVSDNSKSLSAGILIASGDDNYSIYLNGDLIGSGEGWQKAEEWNVDIKDGNNSIVIAAHNNANGTHPGAAIASLKIGSKEIYTDQNWKFTTEPLGSYTFGNSGYIHGKQAIEYGDVDSQICGIVHHGKTRCIRRTTIFQSTHQRSDLQRWFCDSNVVLRRDFVHSNQGS